MPDQKQPAELHGKRHDSLQQVDQIDTDLQRSGEYRGGCPQEDNGNDANPPARVPAQQQDLQWENNGAGRRWHLAPECLIGDELPLNLLPRIADHAAILSWEGRDRKGPARLYLSGSGSSGGPSSFWSVNSANSSSQAPASSKSSTVQLLNPGMISSTPDEVFRRLGCFRRLRRRVDNPEFSCANVDTLARATKLMLPQAVR